MLGQASLVDLRSRLLRRGSRRGLCEVKELLRLATRLAKGGADFSAAELKRKLQLTCCEQTVRNYLNSAPVRIALHCSGDRDGCDFRCPCITKLKAKKCSYFFFYARFPAPPAEPTLDDRRFHHRKSVCCITRPCLSCAPALHMSTCQPSQSKLHPWSLAYRKQSSRLYLCAYSRVS